METDRRILNKFAKACVQLEACGYISERDKAAQSLAYTLCRVVLLGMNNLDQTAPGSARTGKSRMTLTPDDIKDRIQRQYEELMEVL